jgi:hypothetical protein
MTGKQGRPVEGAEKHSKQEGFLVVRGPETAAIVFEEGVIQY